MDLSSLKSTLELVQACRKAIDLHSQLKLYLIYSGNRSFPDPPVESDQSSRRQVVNKTEEGFIQLDSVRTYLILLPAQLHLSSLLFINTSLPFYYLVFILNYYIQSCLPEPQPELSVPLQVLEAILKSRRLDEPHESTEELNLKLRPQAMFQQLHSL